MKTKDVFAVVVERSFILLNGAFFVKWNRQHIVKMKKNSLEFVFNMTLLVQDTWCVPKLMLRGARSPVSRELWKFPLHYHSIPPKVKGYQINVTIGLCCGCATHK